MINLFCYNYNGEILNMNDIKYKLVEANEPFGCICSKCGKNLNPKLKDIRQSVYTAYAYCNTSDTPITYICLSCIGNQYE